MENLSTFKVEFYAKKSSDNTLVHIQSNTDGDLRNNTTFSWNDYEDLLNTLNVYLTNETYSDVLARVQALADTNYENSDFSDWVSLKTGTTSAATPSTPTDIKPIEVVSWAKSNYQYKDIGNLIFETDTECKKYIVRTYYDDEKMGNDSIITPDETPTTKTASVTFSNIVKINLQYLFSFSVRIHTLYLFHFLADKVLYRANYFFFVGAGNFYHSIQYRYRNDRS